jgi:hypothetical protein
MLHVGATRKRGRKREMTDFWKDVVQIRLVHIQSILSSHGDCAIMSFVHPWVNNCANDWSLSNMLSIYFDSRSYSVRIVTRLRADFAGNRDSVPGSGPGLFFVAATRPALSTRDYFLGVWSWPLTLIWGRGWIILGAVPPLPHTFWWRGASTRALLYVSFTTFAQSYCALYADDRTNALAKHDAPLLQLSIQSKMKIVQCDRRCVDNYRGCTMTMTAQYRLPLKVI